MLQNLACWSYKLEFNQTRAPLSNIRINKLRDLQIQTEKIRYNFSTVYL